MTRTFAGKLASLAALLGFVVIAVLAGAGYALVSTIQAANSALSTYADELVLAWSLQEAFERKLAAGRGFLIAHDRELKQAYETASADTDAALAKLRVSAKEKQGVTLLDDSARALRAHDSALREVMELNASPDEVSRAWTDRVHSKAVLASQAMDAFTNYNEKLLADERQYVTRAQQRAAWVMSSTALGAILLGFFGGGALLRSAKRTYSAEKEARSAAEHERQFFHSLLDQLPLGIVAADPSGEITHVSGFARTTLPEADLAWATASTVRESLAWPASGSNGSRHPAGDLPLARALRGEVVAQQEIRATSDRVYSVTAGPIRAASGDIVAAVVAIADISERKRGEKERELFIGALGHDLRNPLQAISVAADSFVRRKDVPDAAKKPAMRIASSAQRMNRLISDLLDFARSQHGAIPIKPESCDWRDIAADVIAEIKLTEPNRDVRVERQGRCNGNWDRARMAQVFQNLLVNAVRHGAQDSPIVVRTGCDGDRVWAKVTNRGVIPREERHRIFDPFRARSTSSGLGLGLYIARAIVEGHGGDITVECDGESTTFMVKLPRYSKAQPEEYRSTA